MSESGNVLSKKLRPLYGFFAGICTAIVGERGASYLIKRHTEYKENEMEKLAEKVIKKYKQETEAEL